MSEIKVLKVDEKYKTSYCIPTWMRDEQIRIAIKKVKGRLQPVTEIRSDPIAIVCYGPSLNDTWEEVKKFKYIISMSGSHRFLIERGIIPTWHTAVDPRIASVEIIGQPHKDVEYLISSTCHPKVFDLLEGYNVKLWHVFDSSEEGFRILPRGEWALTGGSNIGLRSMAIARFMGFTDLHIFGMDGSEGKTGKHAAAHPEQAKESFPCEYDGRTFYTTPSFLECAKQTFHELDELKDVTAKFYGDGLVQAMAKHYVPKHPIGPVFLGQQKPELISPEYLRLNKQLHLDNVAYGVGGGKHAKEVLAMAKNMGTTSILDYGCGKGYLAKEIPFPIWEYDPAIEGKDQTPRPADLVFCGDVLEHIEPAKLMPVLADLRRCTLKLGYFIIHTGKSSKTLADGRNAHLIQQGEQFWKAKLSKFFNVGSMIRSGPLLHVLVEPPGMLPAPAPAPASKPSRSKENVPMPGPMPPIPDAPANVVVQPGEVLKLVIGGTRKDRIPALVTAWSAKKRATCPLEIIHTWDKEDLPKRPCPTGFSFVRFQVSEFCGWTGRGLYLDSDMIVYGDLAELRNFDMGGTRVCRPVNQSAVLLVNCDLWKWDVRDLLDLLDKGELTYQKMLWELQPCQNNGAVKDIGYLPPEWNMLDAWADGTKILHYTKVPTQPWTFPNHRFGNWWYKALADALKDGAVTMEQIEEDEKLGHIRPEVEIKKKIEPFLKPNQAP